MTPFAEAVSSILSELIGDAMAAIDGIPEPDLNEWRPAAGLEDINTFYALMVHTLGAGEYWILHAAAGQPTDRDRPAVLIPFSIKRRHGGNVFNLIGGGLSGLQQIVYGYGVRQRVVVPWCLRQFRLGTGGAFRDPFVW